MKAKTRRAINTALDQYNDRFQTILTRAATAGYMAGDISAQQQVLQKIDFPTTNQAALNFAVKYQEDLVMKGGSRVNVFDKKGRVVGTEFKPWATRFDQDTREEIFDIVKYASAGGRFPGNREHPEFGYEYGSVATDLKKYFDDRTSHASMVARTETARVLDGGMMDRYNEMGVANIKWLNGYNPCPICAQFGGKIYPIDKQPALRPVHPDCTCTVVPVLDQADLQRYIDAYDAGLIEGMGPDVVQPGPDLPQPASAPVVWKPSMGLESAQTNSQLEQWYKKYYPDLEVSLGGMEFQSAKDSSIAIDKFCRKYEDVTRAEFKGFNIADPSEFSNPVTVLAHTNSSTKKVEFNSHFFTKPYDELKKIINDCATVKPGQTSPFHPVETKDHVDSVVIHEMGHVLQIGLTRQKGSFTGYCDANTDEGTLTKLFHPNTYGSWTQYAIKHQKSVQSVSNYALKDGGETFAESMVINWYNGKPRQSFPKIQKKMLKAADVAIQNKFAFQTPISINVKNTGLESDYEKIKQITDIYKEIGFKTEIEDYWISAYNYSVATQKAKTAAAARAGIPTPGYQVTPATMPTTEPIIEEYTVSPDVARQEVIKSIKPPDPRLFTEDNDFGDFTVQDAILKQKRETNARLELVYKDYIPDKAGAGAINTWSGGGYRSINQYLRSTDAEQEAAKSLEIPVTVHDLTKLINEAPELPAGCVIYRGVGANTAKKLISADIGDTVKDYGFQSYSQKPDVAQSFAITDPDSNDRAVIRLTTIGGEKGVSIPWSGIGVPHNESEVLLQRETEIRIIGRTAVRRLNQKIGVDENVWIIDAVVDPVEAPSVPPLNPVIARISKKLNEHAQEYADTTMNDLEAAAKYDDGKLTGTQFRVKTQESIAEKIHRDLDHHEIQNPEEAVKAMHDTVRFTVLVPEDHYAESMDETLDYMLRVKGYRLYKAKNFWKNTNGTYKGVNCQLVNANGDFIELQFHTDKSWNVKQNLSHPIYQEQKTCKDPERVAELDKKLIRMWDEVPTPAGAMEWTRSISRGVTA